MRPPRWTAAVFLFASLLAGAASADEVSYPSTVLHAGGGSIGVEFEAGGMQVSHAEVERWIGTAAKAVSRYYGRYPVAKVLIQVQPRAGRSGATGTTYGDEDGALIRLGIGSGMTPGALQSSWVMTHEMVHLAFPRAGDNQHWAEEGQATYIEPVARAEIGDLSVESVWQQALEGMPKGLPQEGDRGLDNTPTWGRTYWGGALFYLLADVRIRERTRNKYGLQDALAAVVAAGGNVENAWPLQKSFAVADKAVGVPVLEELYAQWKDKPVDVDLSALWRKLGVSLVDGKVRFDDRAPDAAIRKAITAPGTR